MSAKFACPVSGFTLPEIEPRLFSFNNPYGACPACDGLGRKMLMDPELIVPDHGQVGGQGCGRALVVDDHELVPADADLDLQALRRQPGHALARSCRRRCARSSSTAPGSEQVRIELEDGLRKFETKKPFEGVVHNLQRRWRETESAWMREELSRYMSSTTCEACGGYRLKPEALCVKIAGRHIGEVTELSIRDAVAWFAALPAQLTAKQQEIAARVLKEIRERLGFLDKVGLSYLTLARDSGTLSGGESQRIRLASQIGSGLTGVLYVLDEPSIGLHQRDNDRLLETLRNLRDLGNTVIVVEHDEDAIRSADHLIDMGPGAGVHGGVIVAEGTPDEVMARARLAHRPVSLRHPRDPGPGQAPQGQEELRWLELTGCRANNLQDVDARFPLGCFVGVTGVSGSGKSSLVVDTLYPVLARRLMGARAIAGDHDDARRHRACRQGGRHRPVADRPHAALQPGHLHRRLHPDPRLVRRPARGQGARLRPGPVQLQRQGRPLRGLPGRRADQDRDALPARRVRHLRRLPGQALQPRDAGGDLPRRSRSPTCST